MACILPWFLSKDPTLTSIMFSHFAIFYCFWFPWLQQVSRILSGVWGSADFSWTHWDEKKKVRLDKDFITRFFLWASQWTPIEMGAQTILIFLVTFVSPPWKMKVPFAPNHNNFLDTSSLVKSPHLIKATMIISIKLMPPNPSTIRSTWNKIRNLTHNWTTYAWMQIEKPLSIVLVTSSHDIIMNWASWIMLTMVSWTYICMNSTMVQPSSSN